MWRVGLIVLLAIAAVPYDSAMEFRRWMFPPPEFRTCHGLRERLNAIRDGGIVVLEPGCSYVD